LICPVCSSTAPKPSEIGTIDFSYSYLFNLLGWPAAVVRIGRTTGGLPIGIQIVGHPWREDQVLAMAAYCEKKFGGWKSDFSESALVEVHEG
jgi:amidase